MLARLGLPLIAVIACLWAAAMPACAQEDAAGGSFITPFPPGDTYNLGDDRR